MTRLGTDTLFRSKVCLIGSSFLIAGVWGRSRGYGVFSSTLTATRYSNTSYVNNPVVVLVVWRAPA